MGFVICDVRLDFYFKILYPTSQISYLTPILFCLRLIGTFSFLPLHPRWLCYARGNALWKPRGPKGSVPSLRSPLCYQKSKAGNLRRPRKPKRAAAKPGLRSDSFEARGPRGKKTTFPLSAGNSHVLNSHCWLQLSLLFLPKRWHFSNAQRD